MVEYAIRENSTSVLERGKTLGCLKKYERMYPEANLEGQGW